MICVRCQERTATAGDLCEPCFRWSGMTRPRAQSVARAEDALAYVVQHPAALRHLASIQEPMDRELAALCQFIPDGWWFDETRYCICGMADYLHNDATLKRAAALYLRAAEEE